MLFMCLPFHRPQSNYTIPETPHVGSSWGCLLVVVVPVICQIFGKKVPDIEGLVPFYFGQLPQRPATGIYLPLPL